MILILNNNNYVFAYNKNRTKESVDTSKGEVWYEGDFEFGVGEEIAGKGKRYKWNGTEVEIEYFNIPKAFPTIPQPTQLDRIEAAVTASNEQIAQEAVDAYTLELMEEGVI